MGVLVLEVKQKMGMRSLDLIIVISYQDFDKKHWFSFALFLSKMKQSSMRNSMKIVISFPNVSSKQNYLFLRLVETICIFIGFDISLQDF